MKYIAVFISLFSMYQLTQAQDTLWISEDADIVSRKQAAYFRIHSEGPPWTIEEYYYPSQLPKRTGSYPSEETREQDTLWNGLWTFYTEEGVLSRKTEYLNGLKDGIDSSWHVNGLLAFVKSYEKDELRGRFQEWGKEGQLSEIRNYNNEGLMIDEWEVYHEHGAIARRIDFTALDTTVNWFYDDGQLKMTGKRIEGRLAIYKAYAPDGSQTVVNGKGTFEETEDGIIIEAGNYKDGFRNGTWTKYRKDGSRKMAAFYVKGKAYVGTFYDASGKKILNADLPECELKDDHNPYSPVIFLDHDIEPRPLNISALIKDIGYPVKARNAGIQGEVVARVLIDSDGEMVRMKFVQQVHPLLEDAIESKMDQIRFTPAIQNHEPIRFWVNIPFNFSLLN